MIGVALFGAAVLIGLLLLLVKISYGGGYTRGYVNGKVDGYRKAHRDLTGVWPQSPERRPGVVEQP